MKKLSNTEYMKRQNKQEHVTMRMYKLWCHINGYNPCHFKTLKAWVNDELLD